MSRHRFCPNNDRDAFIEELAEDLWEDRRGKGDLPTWDNADPRTKLEVRKLAAETLRVLEHGHG